MNNKQFRKFILAEIDKVELNKNAPLGLITFYDFRHSKYMDNKYQTLPGISCPAEIIKIKFDTGEWIIKTNCDLRNIYYAIKSQWCNKKTKELDPCIKNIRATGKYLKDALASGQVTFTPNKNRSLKKVGECE